jgi:Mitochondrial ribosomal protein (VAR1)
MNKTINKNNLAPIFEKVITQKIKKNIKNQIIKKEDTNNNNVITLISEKTKAITFKNYLNKKITFVRLYDKHLYLFLSNFTKTNLGLFEPKSKKNCNNIINNNKNPENLNTNLSQYGNGNMKMLTHIKMSTNFSQSNFNYSALPAFLPFDILAATQKKENLNSNSSILEETKKFKETQPNINKYIKVISLFNSEEANSENLVYLFNKSNKITSNRVKTNIFNILEHSFLAMSSLISKPVFVITPSKIVIQLFYYLNKNLYFSKKNSKFLALNNKKLQLLCLHLSKFYKKPVELDLDRLYYPYYDSYILSNMIGFISNIFKYRIIIRKLFNLAIIKKPTKFIAQAQAQRKSSFIPSLLSGIKIRLAGRLLTQRVIPKLTVKTIQRGTLARGKTNLVNSARFTNKNRRGAYSITVSIGHVFF